MQFSSRDLRSESRPAQGNEQRDTLEMSGCAASSASSVGCTSESVVEKVLLLFISGDISTPYKHIF